MALSLTSAVIPPWVKPVAFLLMVAAVFGAGMYLQSRLELADRAKAMEAQKEQLESAHEAQRLKLEADLASVRQSESAMAVKLEAIVSNYDSLTMAVAKLKPQLVIRGKPDAQGHSTTRLSPAFRLCWNAAVLGTPEAVAACGAFKLPDTVPGTR